MTVLIVVLYMSIAVNSIVSITMQEFYSLDKCIAAKTFIDNTVGKKSLSVYATCVPK